MTDVGRRESDLMERVHRFLAGEPEAEVPDRLNLAVRAALESVPMPEAQPAIQRFPAARMPLRPLPAFGLATTALVSLMAGLALPLAETRVGGGAPALAYMLILGYLMFSGATALPVLLLKGRAPTAAQGGARR